MVADVVLADGSSLQIEYRVVIGGGEIRWIAARTQLGGQWRASASAPARWSWLLRRRVFDHRRAIVRRIRRPEIAHAGQCRSEAILAAGAKV